MTKNELAKRKSLSFKSAARRLRMLLISYRRYYITTKGSSYGEFALMLSRFLFDVAKHSLSIARREWSSRRQVPPDMNLSLDWTRGFAEARIFGFLLGT